jgi:V/A-type H+-transporting ATPase subunit I
MLYPEKMSRVTIVSPKTYQKKVIDALYDLKVLHIKDYIPKEGVGIGAPLKDAEKISKLILDLQSIKFVVALPEIVEKKKMALREIDSFLKDIKGKVVTLSNRKSSLDEGIKSLEKQKEELEFLSDAGIERLESLSEYDNFDLIFGYTANVEKLQKIKEISIFYKKKREKAYPVVILTKKGRKPAVKIDEISILVRGKGSIEEKKSQINREIKDLTGKKLDVEKELKKISATHGGTLNYIEKALFERIKKSEAPLRFAASEFTFLVTGWVPEKNVEALRKKLSEISRNIFAKFEKPTEDEEVPTKISNPRPVKPYQFFLELYTIPKYNEIDPTFFIFLTFPLFYGFILGDIGYGAILLALGLILRMRRKHALIDILIMSSLTTMLFGFFFGEIFGAGEFFGYKLHPYLHRIHDINQLMIVSAVIGLVHLNTGFIFGFVNEFRHHGFLKAVTAKISWIGLQIAAILFVLNTLGYAAVSIYAIAAIAIISLLALLKAEGMYGIIELPSLISNILSYLRLAAVGLASAALALVVNDFAGKFFLQGGIMIAAGIATLVLGHAINLALGVLGSFLHSMRLHYVEMFTKFYGGSGREYEPFGE